MRAEIVLRMDVRRRQVQGIAATDLTRFVQHGLPVALSETRIDHERRFATDDDADVGHSRHSIVRYDEHVLRHLHRRAFAHHGALRRRRRLLCVGDARERDPRHCDDSGNRRTAVHCRLMSTLLITLQDYARPNRVGRRRNAFVVPARRPPEIPAEFPRPR